MISQHCRMTFSCCPLPLPWLVHHLPPVKYSCQFPAVEHFPVHQRVMMTGYSVALKMGLRMFLTSQYMTINQVFRYYQSNTFCFGFRYFSTPIQGSTAAAYHAEHNSGRIAPILSQMTTGKKQQSS